MPSKTDRLEEKFETLVRSPAFLLFAGGILLLIFSGWLWWAKVYCSPCKVFDGMLANNLSVSSVRVHHVSQERNGLKYDKTSELVLGTANTVKITTTIMEPATKAAVKNEIIATPDKEFLRYVDVSTKQKGQDGQVLDFKKVLNKWASNNDGPNSFVGTVLPEAYVFPQANLTPEGRSLLLRYLRDNVVFDTDYQVTKSKVNGRSMYAYNVNIQPVAYIAFLKAFATRLGLTQLDNLDPAQLQGVNPIKATVTVDVSAHRLYKVEYPSLGYTETFGDYNLVPKASIPKASISIEQLKQLFGQLQ